MKKCENDKLTKKPDFTKMPSYEIIKRIEKTIDEVNRIVGGGKILVDKPVEKQPKPKGEYRED